MTYYDEDQINLLALEEYHYTRWEREQKNKILSMTNGAKKQIKWNELFPRQEELITNQVY